MITVSLIFCGYILVSWQLYQGKEILCYISFMSMSILFMRTLLILLPIPGMMRHLQTNISQPKFCIKPVSMFNLSHLWEPSSYLRFLALYLNWWCRFLHSILSKVLLDILSLHYYSDRLLSSITLILFVHTLQLTLSKVQGVVTDAFLMIREILVLLWIWIDITDKWWANPFHLIPRPVQAASASEFSWSALVAQQYLKQQG